MHSKLELFYNIQKHFLKEEEKILKNKKELRLNTLIPLKFQFFECDKKFDLRNKIENFQKLFLKKLKKVLTMKKK